ncbi:MAG: ATP-binding cassette domain-containing protein [Prolixibacteraceae bacterium]|nr:ATP-binding cassette domain-containing protein [Prolixibacteraceae bacterium]MBN2650388.1 ATP-binding cassette domain-containing protein [Prolixibacteraceae bacterium]
MDFFNIKNVSKSYSGHQALTDVSIDIKKGQVFGLLGPNGAGKTTLIRIINQITAPDSGSVFFDGKPLKADDIYRIGYLPEERGLYKKMKVGEQSLYLAQLKGLSRRDALRKLKYWFEKFEIQGWWDKKLMELSKGMQQKVQFICTVLHEPQLLIFDEPFSGFDPINANLLKQEILNLRENGATIIFSTHNMSSVEEICDHVALINKSRKILDGNIFDVKEKYKTNTFDVVYKGSFVKLENALGANIQILQHNETDRVNELTVRHLNGGSHNDLLMAIAANAEVLSYTEQIPSMNEVFIRVVNENN